MISTKGRYALRVMIDLAQNPDRDYIPLKEISARQQISEKYLEIIVKLLVSKKYIKGLRGKGGGYTLTRDCTEYTVGEIIEAAEGPLISVACLNPESEPCQRREKCCTLPMWKKYDELVHDFFYGICLSDLVNGTHVF